MVNQINSVEIAEQNLISCILNDQQALIHAAAKIDRLDFSNRNLGIIFNVSKKLNDDSQTVNVLTVTKYIEDNQELQFDDFHNIISRLKSLYTGTEDIDSLCQIIKENSIKSNIKRFGQELINEAFDSTNFDEKAFELSKRFLEITNAKNSVKLKPISSISEDFREKMESIASRSEDGMAGITSGYASINAITNGFQPGDLIILAARPGIGKTALALNILLNAAKDISSRGRQPGKKPECVVMFSLEMGADQLLHRLVGIDSLLDLSFKNLKKTLEHYERDFLNSVERVSKLPILIDDSSDISILDIQSQLKTISNTYDIKLVVVDYLQLLRGPKNLVQTNRQQEVSFISRMLKNIARDPDINAPIIAIAQLSRAIAQRGENARPLLSDLRESGTIEQDADLVTFIYYNNENEQSDYQDDSANQETVKNQNKDGNLDKQIQPVEFIVEKHRNGPTGSAFLVFDKKYGIYTDADGELTKIK